MQITIPDEIAERAKALGVDVEVYLRESLRRLIEHMERSSSVEPQIKAPESRKPGRPAPAVPKSKKSLYLDEQVWEALEKSRRQNHEDGISATANRLLRQALGLDGK